MYSDLSERQTAILEFIKQEICKKGYPPAVREISEAVGLQSSSTVHGHLVALEEKGYIRRLLPRHFIVESVIFMVMSTEQWPL